MSPACRWTLALTISLAAGLPGRCPAHAETPRTFVDAEADGARLFYQGVVPIAVVSGTPEQIGRQQAALYGDPAREVLKFPRQFAKAVGQEALWPLALLAGQAFIRNVPEPHRRELAALAEAGDFNYGEVAVGNTMLELRRMGCSVVIVDDKHTSTDGPLFGRNFDFPTLGTLHKYSLLVVCRPEGRHAFASVTFPGAIGVFSGMNDAGLAVATLDVERAGDGSPKFEPRGVPLAFVFRRMVEECETVAEAEALLRSIRPTTWMNLAVCDRDEAAVFEITPRTISRRDPDEGILPCTNHFCTEGLTVGERCWRFPRLAAIAEAGAVDVEDVRERLDQANQGGMTLQTMVFEPRSLVLHLAVGEPPTSDDELERIELAPLFAGETAAEFASP